MKKITKEFLQKINACSSAMEVGEENKAFNKPADEMINSIMDYGRFDWANWLIVRLINKKQKVQYAIFAAELVVDIYEKRCPDNDKPRKAIEAARAYLKNPCKKTKDAAYAAADAAAAYAAAAADAAAYAAAADDDAATTYAAAAAYAAYAAYAAADVKKQIINYGLTLIK